MKFAIIKTGGKQYNVKVGDKIKIEKLDGEDNAKINFSDVLLTTDDKEENINIGAPFIKNANVEGKIVRHGKENKIIIFKYKAKKRYAKKAGHKQEFTEVEITNISK